jgi:ATP-dependent DNA helicase PIF1
MQNMRVLGQGNTAEAQDFAQFLLQVGDGRLAHCGDGVVHIPDKYIYRGGCVKDFITWCYPDISAAGGPDIKGKVILTCKNKDVDFVNDQALAMMPGECFHSASVDSIANDDSGESAIRFPTEFLNSVNSTGIPPHDLSLKIGCPLILLRNLNPRLGLCNGTRMQLLGYSPRLLKVKLLNGSHEGTETFLPRINLNSEDDSLPFILKRRQFPVKLAYCMTINKSQGQSMSTVGIWLPDPVFTHGQLYVALSRSGVPENTKILMDNVAGRQGLIPGKQGYHTVNVVYHEVLR